MGNTGLRVGSGWYCLGRLRFDFLIQAVHRQHFHRMEDTKPYSVTMLVTPPSIPASLAGLTVLHHTTLSGDTSHQQRYYKAEEVEQLLAGFSTPVADAELAELIDLNKNASPAPWYAVGQPWGKGNWVNTAEDPHAGRMIADFDTNITRDSSHDEDDADVNNAHLTAAMRNALPGLLARHRTSQEIIGYHARETEALRNYIDVQLMELLAHPELPESIQKVLYVHRQMLIVAKEQAQ
jgi:hypothetical protein